MTRRIAVLLVGWVLVGITIPVLIRIDLGVSPYDVLNTAIGRRLGIQPGTAAWLSAAALLSVAFLLGERPGIATFAGAFAVGAMVNAGLWLLPDTLPMVLRLGLIPPLLLVLYLGVCCIILSALGAGPTEVFMLGLVHHGMSFHLSRWLIEAGCALVGAAMGGAIGLITGVMVFGAGPAIAILLPRVSARVGLPIPGQ
ncbi:MAG: hypothetical protein RI900_1046 [Actinomycetota bacterium]